MEKKIINGTKWSVIGEFSGKIITPIINMVLARLLIPSEFGVVINITIITSFADILTDGGFQKYIIQREFLSNKEKEQVINVAFWTNFLLSIFVYTWIFLFRSPLAQLLGNERLASIIPIASIQVILTSFTSIQIGILRRDFKFKSLFINRIITTAIPLFITIPLALLNFSYWSIIIGNIFSLVISSIILFIQSNWRPKIYYSIRQLKEMFGFSSWTQLESLFIWLTQWSDSFFVGKFMNSYFLGIYKTSMSTVSSILQLISSSTVPAMFSGLARVQNDETKFNNIYYSTQKFSSLFLIPLGIGMYSYS
ncbi:lipopolysaccharide biosynthesis protein, partial [Enterococcus faecium]|nr:lipopolysaccharide biosynthesis protein [Enterococcus faecium]